MLQIDPDARFFVDPWMVKTVVSTHDGRRCTVKLNDADITKFYDVPETAKSMARRVYIARKKGRA